MRAHLSQDAIQAIEQILYHGNDAIVRRKQGGVIILEEERRIKYRTDPIADRKGQSESTR